MPLMMVSNLNFQNMCSKLENFVILDDDIDDDDEEEDEVDEKPSTYAGLSLLGLRQYFSRFFK